jgi:hypothetical protein
LLLLRYRPVAGELPLTPAGRFRIEDIFTLHPFILGAIFRHGVQSPSKCGLQLGLDVSLSLQAIPTCERPDFAARSLWSSEARRHLAIGAVNSTARRPAPKSRVRLRASRAAASQPAPNPSTIVSVVLAKGFSKARFLEGNHGPVHGGPRQDHQDQRPGYANRERYARTDDRERQVHRIARPGVRARH